MLELRPSNGRNQLSLGFAGDSYNTAVMLARQGVSVSYITALGADRFSQQIIDAAASEGIDTGAMFQSGQNLPGLYLIQNDPSGEREFFYWREHSPARRLFASEESTALCIEKICEAQWLYLSGISVAVMGQAEEANFLRAMQNIKQAGVKVAYDPNYRPALWDSQHAARRWHSIMLRHSDLVLPTLLDEQPLWGRDSQQGIIDSCRAAGVGQVAIKCPQARAVAWRNGESAEAQSHYRGPVVDTTGAGDAFNAGYLAACFSGAALAECLEKAHEVASRVIAVRGALP